MFSCFPKLATVFIPLFQQIFVLVILLIAAKAYVALQTIKQDVGTLLLGLVSSCHLIMKNASHFTMQEQ